ncbi:MAG: antitoxin [Planctomycetota bacterium]
MIKMKLNKEEKEILNAYEKGDFKSVSNVKKEIEKYRGYAKSTLQNNKRMNIRISERDLIHIQRRAIEEGLPYQTFISSILHKFITGHLTERTN